ncbi:hypothetical protein N9Y67_03045 [Pseudomonadota bacterium]|nr:hypothetical protein [Pseudomonadota bacterium]
MMSLRGKYSSWLAAFVMLLVVMIAVPAVSESSWTDLVKGWFADYHEAVENAQEDDDESNENADDSENAIELMQVRIEDEISDYAGIEIHVLSEIPFFPEFKAMAEVVNLHAMLTLRTRHQEALSTVRVAKVAANSAKQELVRLKVLSKGAGSIATKKVSYAQAALDESKAKLAGALTALQSINDEAIQIWGETVASWLTDQKAKEWQRLLQHKDSLLLVSLAADDSLTADQRFIRIARDGSREQARKAYYVSPALSTDSLLQGETYYFKTATGKLRAGMHIGAWIAKGNEPLQGVFIPKQAIIWHEGQPWVYVQVNNELYQRKSVKGSLASAGGRFTQTELKAGESLVIKGAQMLLSEEFKWQIADEDDD